MFAIAEIIVFTMQTQGSYLYKIRSNKSIMAWSEIKSLSRSGPNDAGKHIGTPTWIYPTPVSQRSFYNVFTSHIAPLNIYNLDFANASMFAIFSIHFFLKHLKDHSVGFRKAA